MNTVKQIIKMRKDVDNYIMNLGKPVQTTSKPKSSRNLLGEIMDTRQTTKLQDDYLRLVKSF